MFSLDGMVLQFTVTGRALHIISIVYINSMAKSFLVLLVILLLGVVITVYIQRPTAPPAKAVSVQKVLPLLPSPAVSETDSAKADQKLWLRATPGQKGTAIYAFSITDFNGNNARPLFSKTLESGATMSLPYNAWDPTDTYVFITEQEAGLPPDYFVFRADGEAFADGSKFIDLGAVWNAKKVGYTIREASGWASGTLIVVYTNKDDNTNGPLFWFEIPDTAIIQLAR